MSKDVLAELAFSDILKELAAHQCFLACLGGLWPSAITVWILFMIVHDSSALDTFAFTKPLSNYEIKLFS